jgi:hypothetical protein
MISVKGIPGFCRLLPTHPINGSKNGTIAVIGKPISINSIKVNPPRVPKFDYSVLCATTMLCKNQSRLSHETKARGVTRKSSDDVSAYSYYSRSEICETNVASTGQLMYNLPRSGITRREREYATASFSQATHDGNVGPECFSGILVISSVAAGCVRRSGACLCDWLRPRRWFIGHYPAVSCAHLL